MKYILMKERKKENLREKFSDAAIYAMWCDTFLVL